MISGAMTEDGLVLKAMEVMKHKVDRPQDFFIVWTVPPVQLSRHQTYYIDANGIDLMVILYMSADPRSALQCNSRDSALISLISLYIIC